MRGDSQLALSVCEAEKQWVGRWDASDFPLPAVLVILFEGDVSVMCSNQNTCHHHCVGLCLRENYSLLFDVRRTYFFSIPSVVYIGDELLTTKVVLLLCTYCMWV